MPIVHLLGNLVLDGPWKLIEFKDGIEVWKHAMQGWVVHIVRATGEIIEQ